MATGMTLPWWQVSHMATSYPHGNSSLQNYMSNT